MSDVFISYSRKDIAFARLLHKALRENDFETWIDWQDIPPSVDWLAEVYDAIEKADTFVFIISQTSVASEICELEIAHAVKNNKRLIPIVVDEVVPGSVHPSLSALNWIFFKEDETAFHAATRSLIEAIQVDQAWVKEHTRLQVRALEWERNDHEKSYLLRGRDLELAEAWLSQAADKDPKPTTLQTQYLIVSRQEASRRQRITLGAVVVGLVIAIGLGILAWTQRNQAVEESFARSTAEAEAIAETYQRATAESDAVAESHKRATAQVIAEAASTQAVAQKNEAELQASLARAGLFSVEALSHMQDRLDLAMLLSVEALQSADTLQSRSSLLSTLEYNPHLVGFFYGHTGLVADVAFSPDGEYLVSAGCARYDPNMGPTSCGGSEILLWDVESRQLLQRIPTEHTTFMSDITFNPDGNIMATSAWDGTIIYWDVPTWSQIGETVSVETGRVIDLEFSADGSMLASSHEASYNPATGLPGQAGQMSAELRFWDVASHDQIELKQFIGQVSYRNLAFNPDGETFIAAMGSAAVIHQWDTKTREPITGTFETYDDVVYSLAYSPDGEVLALGNYDGSIVLWDLENDQPIGEPLIGHTDNVNSLAFSPDGKLLVSSGSDKSILLWDVDSHQLWGDPLTGHTENVASVAFHPGGDLIASGSDDWSVILWSLQEGSHIGVSFAEHQGSVWDVSYDSDGSLLASAGEDSKVLVWDLTSTPLSTLDLSGHEGHVYSVSFNPQGNLLASGGQDGTVRLWDPHSGRQDGQTLVAHTEPVVSLAFHPEKPLLASGSMDKRIGIWDVNSHEAIHESFEAHPAVVTSLAFSPDGEILASGSCGRPIGDQFCEYGQIRLWEFQRDQVISRTLTGHMHFVYALAFSPDGKVLASGSSDKTVILWDVASGVPLFDAIERHKEVVTNLAFSPDGKILASSSLDKTIILMDVESRQTIGQPLVGHQDIVTSLAFSPDGLKLASGSFDSTVIMWDLDHSSWLENACQRAGRNISQAEWSIYFAEEPYRRTCPQFPDS